MIPVVGRPETLRVEVERVLSSAGVDPRGCSTWDMFVRLCTGAGAGVVVAERLATQFPLGPHLRFARVHPGYPIVVVTGSDPDNLRHLARIRAAAVVFADRELDVLGRVVVEARRQGPFQAWSTQVGRSRALPGPLREAIIQALDHPPSAVPVEAGHPWAPPRSIRAIASRIGRSEDHLARLARTHNVDLKHILGWCVALRAIQIHEVESTSWERIAWRLGYDSLSGLSQHLKRTLDRRPTEIRRGEAASWFAAFERSILRPTLARADPGDPGSEVPPERNGGGSMDTS